MSRMNRVNDINYTSWVETIGTTKFPEELIPEFMTWFKEVEEEVNIYVTAKAVNDWLTNRCPSGLSINGVDTFTDYESLIRLETIDKLITRFYEWKKYMEDDEDEECV